MSEYPESDKLAEVIDESRAIVDFLDWLGPAKGIVLAVADEYGYSAARVSTDALVTEFFGIDRDKLDAERSAMLADIRQRAATEGQP